MYLWQIEAAKKLTDFLQGFPKVKETALKGSLLDENSLDIFSDVDIVIHLSDNSALEYKTLLEGLSEGFSGVFGYQLHSSQKEDVIRICLENGWRFDLSFLYPGIKGARAEDDSFAGKTDSLINSFWFVATMVLTKLGRKDYLIAGHLALELCQQLIVLQMLRRDDVTKTDIHRFGSGEDVPVLHSLLRLNAHDKGMEEIILDILFAAAGHMDAACAELYKSPEKSSRLLEIKHSLFPKAI